MQHKDQKGALEEEKAWAVVAEFFWTEAEFMKLIQVLMKGLDDLANGLNASDKRKLNTLRDDLSFFDRINAPQNHLHLYTEINQKKLDFGVNKEKQEAIAFIKEKFKGNIHQASQSMLNIMKDKIFGSELDYIYFNSMRDEIATLETDFENRINLEVDGKKKQLSNLTILGVQRYPRYGLLLRELRDAYGPKINWTDYESEEINQDEAFLLRKEIQHQIQNTKEINSKADSFPEKTLFKMYIYLRKYEDKNKNDYKNRASHFVGLIERLMTTNLDDANQRLRIMHTLKKNISAFSHLSVSTRYANMLRDLSQELENHPDLLKEDVKFLYNDIDKLRELFPKTVMSPRTNLFSPRPFEPLREMFFYLHKNPGNTRDFAVFESLLKMIYERESKLTINELVDFFAKHSAEKEENKFSEIKNKLFDYIKSNPLIASELYAQLQQLRNEPSFKEMLPGAHEMLETGKNKNTGGSVKFS